jgi:acyl-CoA hydrolase
MDEAAYLCASRYAEAYCVTVAVDHVEFQSPVRVGDMVTLRAAVNYVGKSSMEVGISIVAEDPQQPDRSRRTNRSFFKMVALDESGRPMEVPCLTLETEEDHKWHCEAGLRRQLRERFNRELEAGVCRIEAAT